MSELTQDDFVSMNDIDWDLFWEEKVEPMLSPMSYKPWAVTDQYGRLVVRFETKEEALSSTISRNRRAKQFGINMRYRIAQRRYYLRGVTDAD